MDFGFQLTGARDVAIAVGKRDELRHIFWSIFWTKALLTAVSGVLVAAYYVMSSHSTLASLVLIQYVAVVGTWLFPFWLMQGLERLVSASVITIISKAAALPMIFLLVHKQSDVYFAAFAFGFSGLVLALFGIIQTWRLVGFSNPPRIRWSDVKRRLLEGWPLFLSSAGVSLYSASNVVLLRFVAAPAEVGYFAAADKLRAAAVGLLPLITNIMFPSSARSAQSQDKTYSLRREIRARYPILVVGGVVCLAMFLSAPFAIELLFGHEMLSAIPVLRVMAFSALVIPFSHMVGIHVFVAQGMSKYFSYTLIGSGLVNIVLVIFLGSAFQALGAASSVLTTEIVIALTLAILFYRKFGGRVVAVTRLHRK